MPDSPRASRACGIAAPVDFLVSNMALLLRSTPAWCGSNCGCARRADSPPARPSSRRLLSSLGVVFAAIAATRRRTPGTDGEQKLSAARLGSGVLHGPLLSEHFERRGFDVEERFGDPRDACIETHAFRRHCLTYEAHCKRAARKRVKNFALLLQRGIARTSRDEMAHHFTQRGEMIFGLVRCARPRRGRAP